MSSFVIRRVVRFSQCDPAGIVYYPRYFEMIHDAKEDWFAQALDWPFRHMVGELREGFPIVRLEADFKGGSRLGDELDIALTAPQVGTTSLHLHYAISCGGELRFAARTVVVHCDLDANRPVPIGAELRARIERFRDGP